MTKPNRPRPPAVPLSDEPTLRAEPPWAHGADDRSSFVYRRTVPAPPIDDEVEPDTQSSPFPLRVAVRKTVLDERMLVVRVLSDDAPVPPGSVEACLVLSERLDFDR